MDAYWECAMLQKEADQPKEVGQCVLYFPALTLYTPIFYHTTIGHPYFPRNAQILPTQHDRNR